MPTVITGTDGVSQVQAGAVESGDLASGAIGSGDLPAGSVIQVVQEFSNTETLAGGATGNIDVTPSITITPSSSSSKIYIIHNAGGDNQNTDDITLGIKRNGVIVRAMGRYGFHNQSGYVPVPFTLHFLDSPNTTSPVTYTPFFGQLNNGGDLNHNANTTLSNEKSAVTIAMEIAG